MELKTRIQLRNDIKANWDAKKTEIVLKEGEVGIERDTGKMKLGDGKKTWAELPYFKGDIDLNKLNATSVYFKDDITLAGDYEEVGNVKLTEGKLAAANKSVAELFTEIFTKEINPKIVDQPKVSEFSVSNNGTGTDFEAGTSVTPKWISSFYIGKYNYKSTKLKEPISPVVGTGVTVSSWSVTQDGNTIGSTEDGTGKAFVMGDSTVNFKVVANHTAGNYALSNLNKLPKEDVQIASGSKEKTASFTSYRKEFAGGTKEAGAINSVLVRNLPSSRKFSTGAFEFAAKPGDVKAIFAFPASNKGTPKFEMFTMSWGPFEGFKEVSQVQVADVRGGENGKIAYRVFEYVPTGAFEADTKFKVTL